MSSDPAIFPDLPLPTGGTLREALRGQALNELYNPLSADIDRTVEEALTIIEKETFNA